MVLWMLTAGLCFYVSKGPWKQECTVMESFEAAITSYEVLSRVRCHWGGANNHICFFMEQFRDGERGSALRKEHSQPEDRAAVGGRLAWSLQRLQFLEFTFLETEQIININNEVHLWALHL
jgi:hypothetical protein